jgi:hypothetical protein
MTAELVNAKGFRYGATACQDAASLSYSSEAARHRGAMLGTQPTNPVGRRSVSDGGRSAQRWAGIIEGGWRRADVLPLGNLCN